MRLSVEFAGGCHKFCSRKEAKHGKSDPVVIDYGGAPGILNKPDTHMGVGGTAARIIPPVTEQLPWFVSVLQTSKRLHYIHLISSLTSRTPQICNQPVQGMATPRQGFPHQGLRSMAAPHPITKPQNGKPPTGQPYSPGWWLHPT